MCNINFACLSSSKQIISILLDNGADVNIADKMGETALHRATCKNNLSSLRRLLEYNMCNVDAVNLAGNSAL